MNRSWMGAALLVALCSSAARLDAAPAQPPPRAAAATQARTWEYLVISFGKTYFTDPAANPEVKETGQSKLPPFSKAGTVVAHEAITIQSQMDELGRRGWELVGVVGAIGGDQQMIFKRPWEPERSKREAALIAAEGQRITPPRKEPDFLRPDAPPMPDKGPLVDLDTVDRLKSVTEYQAATEKRVKDAVAGLKDAPVVDASFTWQDDYLRPGKHQLRASITVDGTAALLKDGNTFRRSEGKALAEKITSAIATGAELKIKNYLILRDITIAVTVVIKSGGNDTIVGTHSLAGGSPIPWPDQNPQ